MTRTLRNLQALQINTPIDEEVLVQPPKENYHNRPDIVRSMHHAKTLAKTLINNPTTDGTTIYLMAYVDDLVVGNPNTLKCFCVEGRGGALLEARNCVWGEQEALGTYLEQEAFGTYLEQEAFGTYLLE
eukprot:214004-Amphidinium_carterae.1